MNENQSLGTVAVHRPGADLAVVELSDTTRDLLSRAMPDSTRRAYLGDLLRFLTWCHGRGYIPHPGSDRDALAQPFAALLARVGAGMVPLVTNYVGHLSTTGLAPSSIDRALAAIAAAYYTASGAKLPLKPARTALRTYRRDRAAQAGTAPRKAAPVTVDALRAMVATLGPTLAGRRDHTLLVLGFALGARRSELAGLDIADIATTPEGIDVLIRRSKTDKDSAGRRVPLPYGSNSMTCPVRVTLGWVATLAEHGRASGPLFPRIDRHGTIGRAPVGGSADGRIGGDTVARVVRDAARGAGLDPAAAWSGHSLRRGFATEAYRHGADRLRIARHGGWDDNSRALSGYVEEVDRWKANPLIGIGL